MELDQLEFSIEGAVLDYLSQARFAMELKRAEDIFYSSSEEENEEQDELTDFNSWLVYDYRLKDGDTFLLKYFKEKEENLIKEEKDFILALANTYLSVYEILEFQEKKGKIRDIFTRQDFEVNMNSFSDLRVKDLMITRMLHLQDEYHVLGSCIYIPGVLKGAIERSILSKYEDYVNKNGFGTWRDFFKENHTLLYKHLGVIENLTMQEKDEESQYCVWQSIYLIQDGRNTKKQLLENKKIELEDEEKGTYYFKILDNRKILAEMVLKHNKIEIECVSEIDRKKAKKLIESILGENAKHYKDEILHMDELL